MARKGITTTLLVIVTIVVLLIVAIVLLTVFGGAMANFTSLGEAKTQCGLLFAGFCSKSTIGDTCSNTPATWGTALFKVNDVTTACSADNLCKDWSIACPTPNCVFTCA